MISVCFIRVFSKKNPEKLAIRNFFKFSELTLGFFRKQMEVGKIAISVTYPYTYPLSWLPIGNVPMENILKITYLGMPQIFVYKIWNFPKVLP